MKIIENNWMDCKLVSYKGSDIFVPTWTNWVATDVNGVVVAFEAEPKAVASWWEDRFCIGDMLMIGKVDFEENDDWKQSLEYVGE